MEATIHYEELAAWYQRHKAGEIYISGMAFSQGGYKLEYSDTPHMKNSSTPQCSSGDSQSRPFPARPAKMMESAGHTSNTTGAAGVALERKSSNPQAQDAKCKVEPASTSTEPPQAPPPPAVVPTPTAAVRELFKCPSCGLKYDFDANNGECPYCTEQDRIRVEALERIRILAAEHRRAWHLYKKGLAPRPL